MRNLRGFILSLLAAVGVFFLTVDVRYGDLRPWGGERPHIANLTIRNWQFDVYARPACGAGFVLGGGWPCSGAGTYTLSGPSSGGYDVASSNFSVQAVGSFSSSTTITPHDGGNGGIFAPTSLTLTGSNVGTFTYTPLKFGSFSITTTNNRSLTDPSGITYGTGSNVVPGYPGYTSSQGTTDLTLATGLSGDPFGASQAASVTEDTAPTARHVEYTTPCSTDTANTARTIYTMIKPGTGTRNIDLAVYSCDSSAGFGAAFNPPTGVYLSNFSYGGATVSAGSCSNTGLASGWWLCQINGTLGNFTSVFYSLIMDQGTFINDYTGDGSSSVLVYGPVVQ